ncbi:unnamed protein product [Clavelina lepadiformis]|uniref:Uncharacterized protein n=1 Tax=Clavelina lepadiformis TaxID=159417 RepID=A0ABP0F8X4_CLALP
MILNMDAELQYLISISMDKMTSCASSISTVCDRRKPRGMELRKALLIARFLQEVRCAYFSEDYESVAITSKETHSGHPEKYSKIDENENHSKSTDDIRCEESRANLENFGLTHSTSAVSSCVTNSDVVVSRISQLTYPCSVSVSNEQFIYCQNAKSLAVEMDGNTCGDDDEIPIAYEEIEISTIYEVCSSNDEQKLPSEELTMIPYQSKKRQDEPVSDGILTRWPSTQSCDIVRTCSEPVTNPTRYGTKKITTTCPLPKKKRPLPKEFLDDAESSTCAYKSRRTDFEHTDSKISTKSTPISTSNTFSMASRSQVSTVDVMFNAKVPSNPKVVVQMTGSLDSYTPITCSEVYLEKRLNDLSARRFQITA